MYMYGHAYPRAHLDLSLSPSQSLLITPVSSISDAPVLSLQRGTIMVKKGWATKGTHCTIYSGFLGMHLLFIYKCIYMYVYTFVD